MSCQLCSMCYLQLSYRDSVLLKLVDEMLVILLQYGTRIF